MIARLSASWHVAYRAQGLQLQPWIWDFSQVSCHGARSLAGFKGVKDPALNQRPKMLVF